MSLKVWLPLDGNTDDRGLYALPNYSYCTFSPSDDGKIGKCESNGGLIYHLDDEIIGNEWSVCMWVKSSSWYTSTSSNDMLFVKNTSSTSAQIYFSIRGGSIVNVSVNGTTSNLLSDYTFDTDVWYHCAATYDGQTISSYVNGSLIGSRENSSEFLSGQNNIGIGYRSNNADGTSVSGRGYKSFNDVRVYDHCLSAKEIKEISKGLFCHYKMDAVYDGMVFDCSGYGHDAAVTGSVAAQDATRRYSKSLFADSWSNAYLTTPEINMPKDAITINVWFKSASTSPGSNYHMIIASTPTRQWYELDVYKDGYFRSGLHVNGTRYVDNCSSTTALDGNWHMLTISYDGTAVKRYYDAVMESSSTVAITTGLRTPATLTIGKSTSGGYYCKDANISDLRIYATALSDADILALYNVGASVDKNGNVYAYELYEAEASTS